MNFLNKLFRGKLKDDLEDSDMDVIEANLKDVVEEVEFKAHDVIIREGEDNRDLFVVIEGQARITKEIKQGGTKVLAVLDEGGIFGEGGLVSGKPRSASVEAITDIKALRLTYDAFHKLLEEKPFSASQLLIILIKIVNQRLQYVNTELISLYDVNRILSDASGDLPGLAAKVLEKFAEVTNCEHGLILLHNVATEREDVVGVSGESDAAFVTDVNDKATQMVKDFEEKTDQRYKIEAGVLWIPIKNYQGMYLGMVVLKNTEGEFVTDEIKLALAITDQLASTIERRQKVTDDREKEMLDEKDISL